jgi:hypothetical protein
MEICIRLIWLYNCVPFSYLVHLHPFRGHPFRGQRNTSNGSEEFAITGRNIHKPMTVSSRRINSPNISLSFSDISINSIPMS